MQCFVIYMIRSKYIKACVLSFHNVGAYSVHNNTSHVKIPAIWSLPITPYDKIYTCTFIITMNREHYSLICGGITIIGYIEQYAWSLYLSNQISANQEHLQAF